MKHRKRGPAQRLTDRPLSADLDAELQSLLASIMAEVAPPLVPSPCPACKEPAGSNDYCKQCARSRVLANQPDAETSRALERGNREW